MLTSLPLLTPYQVKALISHTWPLLFAHHGRFTPAQEAAIPPLVAGKNILLTAATAAGKTEAILAPLLEHWWEHAQQNQLTLLYICPTRALVRDLAERLHPRLEGTNLRLAAKTSDYAPVSAERPPAILITTPESADALLTRHPKLFTTLRAIIVDEIHLLDNTPRGDHVRCLLERIERIRAYALPKIRPTQRAALSATLPDATGVAMRYLGADFLLVDVPSPRPIAADIQPITNLEELAAALAQRAARKTLLFCNSRAEVEQTAAFLRQNLAHHAEIFVHYSTLDTHVRQEVETQFAAAATAICICTSTLELGIDIGTVDDVALLGAPADLNAFLQRMGRGGRRTGAARVLCLPQNNREWARFEALLDMAHGRWPIGRATHPTDPPLELEETAVYGFRPSVLVQQTFSLIRQHPTGHVRLADVCRLAPAEVTKEAVAAILAQLCWLDYVQTGRLGEWGAGPALHELLDQHEIHSNIGTQIRMATAVDAYSGHELGRSEYNYPKGSVVLWGGRAMRVVWQEKYRFGLAPASHTPPETVLRTSGGTPPVPFAVAQAIGRGLGLPPGRMATLPHGAGVWLFHFWGTVWGKLLATLLTALGETAVESDEYALYLPRAIPALPAWDEQLAFRVARRTAVDIADMFGMGRFHSLLPADVGMTAVVGLLNLPRFAHLYQLATLQPLPDKVAQLESLLP